MIKTNKKISIVITTKNEENNIENCLKSIINQTFPRNLIEIIVVDNYSSDKTLEISRQYADIVDTIGPERNTQRNHGMIDLSSGEYLMWVDADMILSKCLIENSIDFLSKENYVALNIPEIILGEDLFSKVRRFERSFYDNTVIDGARVIKRNIFVQFGGFSRSWQHGPDDWDLDKEIKLLGNIGYLQCNEDTPSSILQHLGFQFSLPAHSQSVIYHNESKLTVVKFILKKAYYSSDFKGYIDKWGKNDPDVKKQIGINYRFFIVFMENGKWKKLIKRLDLYVMIILIRGITGVAYLLTRLLKIKWKS
jgi:glycosyltransferase involved in cell wall biosynthesis